MTHLMFAPVRHHHEPRNPAERRRAHDAFLERHGGWSARALEDAFARRRAAGGTGR